MSQIILSRLYIKESRMNQVSSHQSGIDNARLSYCEGLSSQQECMEQAILLNNELFSYLNCFLCQVNYLVEFLSMINLSRKESTFFLGKFEPLNT